MEPRIQYAKTEDGVSIAYWTMGKGGAPLLITAPQAFGHIALEWRIPRLLAWYEHLAKDRQIVRFDHRGQGMSQRDLPGHGFELATFYEDMCAVCQRLELERTSVLAFGGGCAWAVGVAAEHPELFDRLVLWGPTHGPDYKGSRTESMLPLARKDWSAFTESWAHTVVGWSKGHRAQKFAAFIRESVNQDYGVGLIEAFVDMNITPHLARIQAPTLVLQDRAGVSDTARLMAAGIRAAQLVLLPEEPIAPWEDESGTRAIEDFLGGSFGKTPLATPTLPEGTAIILFLDIVDSTALTERLGDAAFRAKAGELDASLREAIREAGGTPVEGKVLGDGVMAVFTSARQAIDCALRCRVMADGAALPLHLGIHAGDVLREGTTVYGGAVNLAQRITDASAPGELLVSDTLRGLARTSTGVSFEDRGEHELKGIEEPQRLWAIKEPGTGNKEQG